MHSNHFCKCFLELFLQNSPKLNLTSASNFGNGWKLKIMHFALRCWEKSKVYSPYTCCTMFHFPRTVLFNWKRNFTAARCSCFNFASFWAFFFKFVRGPLNNFFAKCYSSEMISDHNLIFPLMMQNRLHYPLCCSVASCGAFDLCCQISPS